MGCLSIQLVEFNLIPCFQQGASTWPFLVPETESSLEQFLWRIISGLFQVWGMDIGQYGMRLGTRGIQTPYIDSEPSPMFSAPIPHSSQSVPSASPPWALLGFYEENHLVCVSLLSRHLGFSLFSYINYLSFTGFPFFKNVKLFLVLSHYLVLSWWIL